MELVLDDSIKAEERAPLPGSNDAVFVCAVLAGDTSAYGVLYDRYARLIRAICNDTAGNLFEAEDLCQEVFLRGFQGISRLRDPERFGGWLLGIAHLTCREWHKKVRRERRRRRSVELDQIAPPLQSNAREFAEPLLFAIGRLPRRERMALHLFYLQEHPVETARNVMGLSRSGFYRILDRARRRLQRLANARSEKSK
jgi:RNA polymerase sigma-70 factor (ECF subfamily)